VGRDAAHTPSFLSVLSSILEATTKGGAHYRQEKGYLLTAFALAGQNNKLN